jgi:myo-inositol 2-dehydrogenase / D-chiro-inositol 1-dehydrogenase
MDKVKIGFIGCGGISGAHMPNLQKMQDVEFAGMCDVDEEKAKKASALYGGRVFTDFNQMLEEVELNACFICVPPFAHKGQEMKCVEKGIPFLVEKPIHLDIKDAEGIAAGVKEKGLITAVGYQDRYQNIIDYIKPFFSKDTPGFFTGWWVGGMPGVYWWRRKEMSGGQITEQTTHIFDMARYLLGEPVEVTAVKRTGLMKDIEEYNVEDASAVSVYFGSGVFGTIFSGCFLKVSGTGKSGLDFYFKDRIVEYTERQKVKINYGSKIEEISENPQEIIYREDRAFIEAVKTKKPSLIKSSYEDGLKTLRFTSAANRAIESGKTERV